MTIDPIEVRPTEPAEPIPLARPAVADPAQVAADVESILRSGVMTNGPFVRRLEDALVCKLDRVRQESLSEGGRALTNFADHFDGERRCNFTRVVPAHPIRNDQKAEVEINEPSIFVCGAAALMGHAIGRQRHWTPRL